MPIKLLLENHPLYQAQAALLERLKKLEQLPKEILTAIENILENYFASYDIEDPKEIAIEKFNNLKLQLESLFLQNKYYLYEKNEILQKLAQFHPKHIPYYKIKRALAETLVDSKYDQELQRVAKTILNEVNHCRDFYRTSEKDETTFTKLLTCINQGIINPTDEANFNELGQLQAHLPKQKIDTLNVATKLVGGVTIFVGLLGVATAIASVVLSGGAAIPGAALLFGLSIGFVALGSKWIRDGNYFFNSTPAKTLEFCNIRTMRAKFRLFKETQKEIIDKSKLPHQPICNS